MLSRNSWRRDTCPPRVVSTKSVGIVVGHGSSPPLLHLRARLSTTNGILSIQSAYSADYKVYGPWDYSPSRRLALEISDPELHQWDNDRIFRRWYDRKTIGVETRDVGRLVALLGEV